MNIISLFSGCGGLDLGFRQAGFNPIWANEYAANIWETYEKNHHGTFLDKRSITKIKSDEIPDTLGVIGGPPCQSWSTGGAGRGLLDKRGKLFLEYVRVITDKAPLFFVAENVQGILAPKHRESLNLILDSFRNAGTYGYNVSLHFVNAKDFNVPQDRKRVFIIGYRKDLGMDFVFPKPSNNKFTTEVIRDLSDSALPSSNNYTIGLDCVIPNHEYALGSFSYIFMSRNRVLSWDKPSFTIQASARQVSLHPDSPKMVKVETDVMRFIDGREKEYRRLSIRECARIQSFPDDFIFYYSNLNQGYKMVGNAVPVNLSLAIADKIMCDLVKIVGKVDNVSTNMVNENRLQFAI